MTPEQNKAVVRSVYEGITNFWKTGDLSFLDKALDVNFKQHIAGFPPGMDNLNAMKQMMPMFKAAMPDMTMTVHDVIAEGDKVATRVSWRGTQTGEMMNMPASGKRLEVTEMHFYRISPTSGKIVERWGEWDVAGMMQQMGAMPGMSAQH